MQLSQMTVARRRPETEHRVVTGRKDTFAAIEFDIAFRRDGVSATEKNMDAWREIQTHALLNAKTEEAIAAILSCAARDLGFEYCAYGMRVPVPITRPKVIMLNNYPARWRRRYVEANYLATDPTVAHGLRSILPLVWADEIFASCPQFWEEARAHGLCVGWAQACYDPRGIGGMLTLARSHGNLSPAELKERSPEMSWLVCAAHQASCHRLLPRIAPETDASLSEREIEALRWTADGKTAAEIATIMSIAERTVNFHIRNATAKLDAGNKTAATIRAAMLRLL